MNTIRVEANKLLGKDISILNLDKDTIIYFIDCDIKLDIVCNRNIKVYEYVSYSNINANYIINSNLNLNIFSVDSSIDNKMNLNVENIKLNYNYSTINDHDNVYNLSVFHNKKNTCSNACNHGININDKKLDFIINGYILKESVNVVCNQDNKIIIMDNNNSSIKPNLFVDNNEISANHSAYIGKFKKDDIFYLMSRGINYDDANKMLAKSFLLGNMNFLYEEKELILKMLEKYWR